MHHHTSKAVTVAAMDDLVRELRSFFIISPIDKFSPYAGIGWNWGEKVIASLDVGVMFHGTPDVSLEANCAADAVCEAVVDGYEGDVQEEVNDYSYYPVVRFGLGF